MCLGPVWEAGGNGGLGWETGGDWTETAGVKCGLRQNAGLAAGETWRRLVVRIEVRSETECSRAAPGGWREETVGIEMRSGTKCRGVVEIYGLNRNPEGLSGRLAGQN